MDRYIKLAENHFYDGNGCYDSSGKCFCAECYHYGSDSVNCGYAGSGSKETFRFENGKFVLNSDEPQKSSENE